MIGEAVELEPFPQSGGGVVQQGVAVDVGIIDVTAAHDPNKLLVELAALAAAPGNALQVEVLDVVLIEKHKHLGGAAVL